MARMGPIRSWGLALLLASVDAPAADARLVHPETSSAKVDETMRAHADAWVGRYHFVGGQAEFEGRDAAIEEIVQQLNVLIRGIARERLTKANPIPESLTITRSGDDLTVSLDERAHTAPLDGSVVDATDLFGDPIEYHVELDERRLRQHIVGKGGARTNTYRKAGSAKIVMKVRITAPRLPAPLTYSLTYAKQ